MARQPKPRPLEGKRILIAEDEYLVAQDLQRTLEGAGGIVVGAAPTIRSSNHLADEVPLDGAIVNLKLTDGSGLRVLEHLRLLKVPFIVLSGFPRSQVPQALRDAPFIGKPYANDDLIALAARHFGGAA